MHVFQLMDRHVRVDLRGVDRGVAQQLLDKADVRAVLQHQGGHTVPEQVAGARLAHPGLIDVFLDQPAEAVRLPGLAGVIQEHPVLAVPGPQQRPTVLEVMLYRCQGPLTDRHEPILVALALTYRQYTGAGVDVIDPQVDQFLPADTRAVQYFQHAPVAQAGHRLQVRQVEDLVSLLRCQCVFR